VELAANNVPRRELRLIKSPIAILRLQALYRRSSPARYMARKAIALTKGMGMGSGLTN